MRKLAFLAFLGVASVGFSQTRQSFLDVDSMSGITVNISNGGLTYEVILGSSPTFTLNSISYDITDLFGFWVLDNEDPDNLNASAGKFGDWDVNVNYAQGGGIAGWRTNPNTGITPGNSETFTFTTLNSSDVEQLGFHVRIDGVFPGTLGDTGYITLVPEPASLAVLGLGALALLRRRRQK